MIEIDDYYGKLARQEVLSEDEIVSLLKELKHLRQSLAHMASCQAATLESLPRSFSRTGRARHIELCETAAALLAGDSSRVRFQTTPEHARDRCLKAVAMNQAN